MRDQQGRHCSPYRAMALLVTMRQNVPSPTGNQVFASMRAFEATERAFCSFQIPAGPTIPSLWCSISVVGSVPSSWKVKARSHLIVPSLLPPSMNPHHRPITSCSCTGPDFAGPALIAATHIFRELPPSASSLPSSSHLSPFPPTTTFPAPTPQTLFS